MDNCKITNTNQDGVFENPNLVGEVELDSTAAYAIARQLCKPLKECIITTIEEAVLAKASVDSLTVSKKLNLSPSVERALMKTIHAYIEPKLVTMLEGATLTGINLADATMDTATLTNILDGIIATAALNTELKTLVLNWVGEDIEKLLKGKILLDMELKGGKVTDGTISNSTIEDSWIDRAHLRGTTEIEGDIVFGADAREALARTLKEIFGIEALISADGHRLNGTEGLVTKCILAREIQKVQASLDAVTIFRYRDSDGELIENGARLTLANEHKLLENKVVALEQAMELRVLEIKAVNEALEKLATSYVEFRKNATDRLHALELAAAKKIGDE